MGALLLGLPLAIAQDSPPAPVKPQKPPAHQGMPQWQGHKDGADRWGQDGGMKTRRWQREQRLFKLARLVNQPEIRQRLGITAEQAAKIRTQTLDFRKTEIHTRAELAVNRLELRDLLAADQPDRNAIDGKLQEISALRLAGEKAAIDYRLAMREALTPEQRQKLRQMRDNFPQGGPGPQGPHRPHAPSPNAEAPGE